MLALSLLLAGFIIVFLVLILLIIIITVYGKIIQAAQKSSKDRKERKVKKVVQIEPSPASSKGDVYIAKTNSDEIPPEIIAVIAAAVDAMYGSKPHKVKTVKRSRGTRSVWGNTGVIQNTRPF